MFDDVCMACGKQLDDGSLYCNDECMSADRRESEYSRPRPRPRPPPRSSSRSSASPSSVFTSPYLIPNAPMSDIPPLMLPKKRTSSSSASSAITSEFDEDDRVLQQLQPQHQPQQQQQQYHPRHPYAPPFVDVKSEHMYHLPPLGDYANANANEATPLALPMALRGSLPAPAPNLALPLQFARRPAPADTRSLIHPAHVQSHSQTRQVARPMPPIAATSTHSTSTMMAKRGAAATAVAQHRHSRSHDLRFATTATAAGRAGGAAAAATLPSPPHLPKRNRASLPAYFSRLTLHAASSPSAPTLSHVDVQIDAAADILATPKVSRRVAAAAASWVAPPRAAVIGSNKVPVVKQQQQATMSPSQKEGLRSKATTWASPTTAMPVRVPRVGEPLSLERSRERGRSRMGRSDTTLLLGEQEREDRVEMERRGRSRVVTTRLQA